ncbi:hypothetical protein Vadar_029095 [Vaccinium darrowii]|uniref:Uncharacterized protein n=1 Tax=Vaccinium darrowii TaxID=229202 RepID=A0ACB7Z7A7_9ERIC|nr:hypothetical protein Vadar_029095 [Vaccinium darrowii]
MEMESCVPPGFRFHPTEEELVGYYLRRKVNSLKIDLNVIVEIDLYRMEPWEIEGANWDMKSRTSGISLATRTKNTRLEEGWVVCRAFKKPSPHHKQGFGSWNRSYYTSNSNDFGMPSYSDAIGTTHQVYTNQTSPFPPSPFGSEQELENQLTDSPITISTSFGTNSGIDHNGKIIKDCEDERSSQVSQYFDWKKLDDLLELQLVEPPPFGHSNFPFVSQENELNGQNHESHLFTCFPDL